MNEIVKHNGNGNGHSMLEVSQQLPDSQEILIAQKSYINASKLVLKPEESAALIAEVDPEIVEIRPDGLLYVPQSQYRLRLNLTLGVGQWSLIEHRNWLLPESNKLCLEASLYIRGHFVAKAIGEQEYFEDNPMQSQATAHESAKSDCLTRCCKDLSMFWELWDPSFARKWVPKYAVKVWREKTGKHKVQGNWESGSYQWRRKDSPKFWDEKGGIETNAAETNVTKGGDKKEGVPADKKPNPALANAGKQKPADAPKDSSELSKKISEALKVEDLTKIYNEMKDDEKKKYSSQLTARKKVLYDALKSAKEVSDKIKAIDNGIDFIQEELAIKQKVESLAVPLELKLELSNELEALRKRFEIK